VLLALLVVLLPIVARADSILLTNQFGSVTILNSGIRSYGSQLRSVTVDGKVIGSGHAMGTVSFWTGAFTPAQPGGTVFGSGTFAGGQTDSGFVVKGSAKGDRGTIFSGYFVGPVDWTLEPGGNKFFHEYELAGKIKGQLWNGHMATGSVTEYIYTFWNQEKIDHKGSIHGGSATLNSTPEPGTLGLLGSGILAMAGAIRRKVGRI
jgi:hypothetical protein